MVTLSIVVPIYNTEKYLTKCIDSLLHQDMDDYEILLVNDSSPDNAQNIIDEYKQKFPAIIKSFIKENGGLGDTRNYAIPFAEGKYIMFVDSDDYIKENSLKKLCQMMEEKELDILVYDFIKVYDNRQFIHEKSMHSVSTEEYIMSTPNACNKIFNKDIFIRHGITFPTDIWYEDLAVIPGLAKYTDKIDYVNEGIYFYQFRNESIMNQIRYNPKILDMILSIQNLQHFLEPDFKQEIEFLSLHHLFYGSSLKLLPFKCYDEIIACIEAHEKHYPHWRHNSYYVTKEKLFKIYCNLLSQRKFFLCRCLLVLKTKIKSSRRN